MTKRNKQVVSTTLDQVKYERNIDKHIIEDAITYVQKKIIAKRFILYGGQAIDYALRLRGSSLYSEYDVPDYDFFSSNYVEDAYEMGEYFAKRYDNVSVIRATHPSTMRVRVNFLVVADVTFCPAEIMTRIPTLTYRRMRIVSPEFQRLDVHSSLSNPFQNPPREVIFHRWKKDLERRILIDKYYPVKSKKVKTPSPQQDIGKKVNISLGDLDIDNILITGFLGWFLFIKKYDIKTNYTPDITVDDDKITTALPITYYMDQPKEADLKPKGFTKYNSWFQKRPVMWKRGNIEIYDSSHEAISCECIEYNGTKFMVAADEGIMRYFLQQYYETGDVSYFNIYVEMYTSSDKYKIPLHIDTFKSELPFESTNLAIRMNENKIHGIKSDVAQPECYFPKVGNMKRPEKFDVNLLRLDGKKTT